MALPAAPALTPAQRYTARGTIRRYWVASIADYTAPTAAELTAGTDITGHVMDSSGWGVSSSMIEAPDELDRFTATIPGMITTDEPSLTMYQSADQVDGRVLMPQDAAGFIVIFPGGIATGRKMHVWPVTVASVGFQYSSQGEDPDTMVITFSPSRKPAENVTIPA